MSERKLTEEAREMAEAFLGGDDQCDYLDWPTVMLDLADTHEVALAWAQAFKELAHHFFDELVDRWHHSVEATDALAFWLGLTDEQYAAFVEGRYIDAAQALAAVPVETQEATAPDDYTRPGWRMFPVL